MNTKFRLAAHHTVRIGALLLALAVYATDAHAQDSNGTAIQNPERFRSGQHWAFELKFGPYSPAVDAEFSGSGKAGPHEQYFGRGKRLMGLVALDYQFYRGFGSLGIGAAIGYTKESAKSLEETQAGALTATRSADDTTLSLRPTAAYLVYRADQAARAWHLPIVPYGKLGLSYVFWSIADGNGAGTRSVDPVGKGSGGTAGWYGALGLQLLLDVLDPGAARALDGEVGVNHTYLFLEAAHFEQTGLGKKNVLQVGDSTWFAGLMFEF